MTPSGIEPATFRLVVQCLNVIYKQAVNLLHKLPEDVTDVPKHVGVLKVRTFKCVCNLCVVLSS